MCNTILPFGFKELSVLKNYFTVSIYTYELFLVSLSVLSGLLYRNPKDLIAHIGYKLDQFCRLIISAFRYFYRSVIIVERKPS